MNIISVIPARMGSQSIKLKNLIILNKKPLIYYSINQSLKSKLISRTIVSTDSPKIARVALKFGAEVPFIRPKSISKNKSKDYGFFSHLIHWLKKHENYTPDLIVQLRPTQPFRKIGLIDKAIKIMIKDKRADSLRSISTPERTPYKMWKIKGKYLKYIFNKTKYSKKEYFNLDRRNLKDIYWHDGVIDVVRAKTILKFKNVTGKNISYIKNNSEYLIDIDTVKDLKLTKLLLKEKIIKLNEY